MKEFYIYSINNSILFVKSFGKIKNSKVSFHLKVYEGGYI